MGGRRGDGETGKRRARIGWKVSSQPASKRASSLQSLFSGARRLLLDPGIVCSTRLRFVNDDRPASVIVARLPRPLPFFVRNLMAIRGPRYSLLSLVHSLICLGEIGVVPRAETALTAAIIVLDCLPTVWSRDTERERERFAGVNEVLCVSSERPDHVSHVIGCSHRIRSIEGRDSFKWAPSEDNIDRVANMIHANLFAQIPRNDKILKLFVAEYFRELLFYVNEFACKLTRGKKHQFLNELEEFQLDVLPLCWTIS